MNVLAPPLTNEHGRDRTRLYVRVLLFAYFSVYILVFVSNDYLPGRVASALLVLYSVVCLGFFTRGNMTFSRTTIPFVGLSILVFLTWTGYGLRSPAIPAYPVMIICAALLAGRKAALVYFFLTASALTVVWYGEVRGWVVNGFEIRSTAFDLMYLQFPLGVATAVLWALVHHMELDRDHAQKNADDALSLNQELNDQQAALRERDAQYQLLSENVHDFIWTTDMELNITFASPSCERLFGYTQEEFVGNSLLKVLPPESVERMTNIFREELAIENELGDTGRYTTIEVEAIRKDGSMVWIEANSTFMRDEEGAPVGAVGMSLDISERKQAELEKLELEGQLSRFQKIDSIGQLAGGIAHDFNNLLVAISGYSDLLLADPDLGDKHHGFVDEIVKASERASVLTRQLLSFGSRQIMEIKPLDLHQLIRGLENMITRLIPENIELNISMSDQSNSVVGDSGQLEQLLINLCLNARDAMPSGGKLTIKTEESHVTEEYADTYSWARPGEFIRVSVTDTGEGMEAETLDRIFEPFYTTKEEGKGTGLGMSVVYGIVKQHNGFVSVYSEPGGGTVVRVYFPRTSEEVPKPRSTEPEQVMGGTETILVVEDDDMVRGLARKVLTDAGYKVVEASDGVLGLNIFRENASDIALIISDVVMPEMGGRELMDRVREYDDDQPILFASGYSSEGIHTDFILESGLELIQKPYSPRELLSKVRSTLDVSS